MSLSTYEVSVSSERRSRAGAVAVVRDSYSVRAGTAAQAELEALQAHWAKYPDTRDAMMTGCRRLPGR